MSNYVPSAKSDIQEIYHLVKSRKPFTFIRFSDGEVELLRNRKLVIDDGSILFKGKKFTHNFPLYDRKIFDPKADFLIRSLLIESLVHTEESYYKGLVVSSNNQREDRDFLLRMNGGLDFFITFADLFVNSNYEYFRKKLIPCFFNINNLIIVSNFRSSLIPYFSNAKHIPIPDNMFSNFEDILNESLNKLESADEGAIILSSASSLSNILGYLLSKSRPDITFIDVGSAINDYIGLDAVTRAYHTTRFYSRNISGYLRLFKQKFSKEHKIKW